MDVMAGNLKMQSGTTSLADEDYIYLEKHRNGVRHCYYKKTF